MLECNMCGIISNDVVDHFLMHCSALNKLREDMWEKLIDANELELSVNLFNMPDEQILNIFLSGDWVYKHASRSAADFCICVVADALQQMIRFSKQYLSPNNT
jgi:hypothetical protein